MLEYKIVLGTLAIIIGLVSYIPYIRDIFLGKTKPHAFSWLLWTSLTGIVFFGQILYKGGAGAWVTGFTSIACFVIFILALQKGEKNITLSDTWSLVGAGVALFLWYLTHNPLGSIILLILIDALAFYPTYRKSYNSPYNETILTYFLSGSKWVIAIIALENYSLITTLYPLAVVILNFGFTGLLIVRRRQYEKDKLN